MEDKKDKRIIDIEPLYNFLIKDTSPKYLAELIEEMMSEYILLLIRAQQAEMEAMHEHTYEFFFTMKTLKEVLLECEQ